MLTENTTSRDRINHPPLRGGSKRLVDSRAPRAGTYLVLAAWMMAVSLAIATGAYEGGGNPPVALMASVGLPIALFVTLYRVSSRFHDYVLALDLRLVLAAQLWRVVGGAFLFVAAAGGLDGDFAIPAGVGDIATGIAALAVIMALWNGRLTRFGLYGFTALGVGDFLVAIITGLLARPDALDLWPLIVFPTLAVPLFGILHLVAVLQSRSGWEARVAAAAAPATGITN